MHTNSIQLSNSNTHTKHAILQSNVNLQSTKPVSLKFTVLTVSTNLYGHCAKVCNHKLLQNILPHDHYTAERVSIY